MASIVTQEYTISIWELLAVRLNDRHASMLWGVIFTCQELWLIDGVNKSM